MSAWRSSKANVLRLSTVAGWATTVPSPSCSASRSPTTLEGSGQSWFRLDASMSTIRWMQLVLQYIVWLNLKKPKNLVKTLIKWNKVKSRLLIFPDKRIARFNSQKKLLLLYVGVGYSLEGTTCLQFDLFVSLFIFQALSFAIVTVAMSMFAQLPAPLIYGHLFDASCAEFRDVCGRIGDCLHYDNELFRLVSWLFNPLTKGTFFCVLGTSTLLQQLIIFSV